MATIIFQTPDGKQHPVTANNGENLKDVAVANGIDGIVGECGGAMMCATCHCYIEDARTAERNEGEDMMLEMAEAEVTEHSRLSCQVVVTDAMDGLLVKIPEEQL